MLAKNVILITSLFEHWFDQLRKMYFVAEIIGWNISVSWSANVSKLCSLR